MCTYTIENNATPYPRVKYNSSCGFQLAMMEGYEFDNYKDSGGVQGFSVRSSRINFPSGNCMKCKEAIVNKPNTPTKEV